MKKIFIFLFLVTSLIPGLYGENKDYTQWWLYNHGDYSKGKGKTDPRVAWARQVFARVKNAADKPEGRRPRLFIINSRGEPFALSLPDGGIIINPATLDICYTASGNEKEAGDRRLAFILGHELAHLGNKEYIHHEAFQTLKEFAKEPARKELSGYFTLSDQEKTKTNKKNELLADQKGIIYAAMVGYDINELFGGKENFFMRWARQTGIGYLYDGNSRHPSFRKRTQYICLQLAAVAKQVELFKAGVLLYQVGNYHDGVASFLEFSKSFPSREVFNNSGACYFNIAMHHLYLKYSDVYYKFRVSTPIDYSTTAAAIQPRGEEDYLKDKEFSRYMDKAEDYFRLAVERDPLNKTARYNLAAALILKKEYARAQAECDFILKKDPTDANALNNKAIAFYYYGKEEDLDTIQKGILILEKALQKEPENYEILYNLASLKEERKRLAGAKVYWERYLKLPNTPRDNFYEHIYKKIHGSLPPKQENTAKFPPIPGGIGLGEHFSLLEKQWGKGFSSEYKVGSEDGENTQNWSISLQVIVKGNIRVLALDGTIEIIEQELSPAERNEGIPAILNRLGQPQKIVRHTAGNFYIYRDKGFSVKEIAGKAYSYIWYEKWHAPDCQHAARAPSL